MIKTKTTQWSEWPSRAERRRAHIEVIALEVAILLLIVIAVTAGVM